MTATPPRDAQGGSEPTLLRGAGAPAKGRWLYVLLLVSVVVAVVVLYLPGVIGGH